jgi:transposase
MMQRCYGRAAPGVRVRSQVPHGHWKTISTIAALSSQGIVAASSFDAATDAEIFRQFIAEVLVPQLKAGQVVVMDNLACHKHPKIRQLIEGCGARVLYLPPYSPDLNPIEMAISKIKTLLRKLARRTVEGLFTAIPQALASITAEDATHYMLHCGYPLQ